MFSLLSSSSSSSSLADDCSLTVLLRTFMAGVVKPVVLLTRGRHEPDP